MVESGDYAARRTASYFFNLGRREISSSNHGAYSRRIGYSEGLLMRMNQSGLLTHTENVYDVTFNHSGDYLVLSGDMNITLWDWFAETKKLVYPSGHHDIICHARVLPYTNDSSIATVSVDGQVRLGQLKGGGDVTTKQIGAHDNIVRKLALEPGSPHIFYSCGDDGLVQHFDLRSDSPTRLLTCCSSKYNGRIRLNTIAVDPQNPKYFLIGGTEEYARLYDIRKIQHEASNSQPVDTFCPRHLIVRRIGKGFRTHVIDIAFSNTNEILVSFSDDFIYLFKYNMGLGPDPKSVQTDHLNNLNQPQAYKGHQNGRPTKSVNFFGPDDEYVLSGSDCGSIFVWRKKGGELMRMLYGDEGVVVCIEPHPHFPFLATCGTNKMVRIWTPAVATDSK